MERVKSHAGFLLGDLAAQQFLQSKQEALRLFLCRKTPCMFQHRLIIAIVSLVPMDGRFFSEQWARTSIGTGSNVFYAERLFKSIYGTYFTVA
ncbi:MAG: hypothetical protein L6461_15450 [Anaerolineae bacterium]|nr:hypothetical protein [Anaerolineae bacterium]